MSVDPTTLGELPTARPSGGSKLEAWFLGAFPWRGGVPPRALEPNDDRGFRAVDTHLAPG